MTTVLDILKKKKKRKMKHIVSIEHVKLTNMIKKQNDISKHMLGENEKKRMIKHYIYSNKLCIIKTKQS